MSAVAAGMELVFIDVPEQELSTHLASLRGDVSR